MGYVVIVELYRIIQVVDTQEGPGRNPENERVTNDSDRISLDDRTDTEPRGAWNREAVNQHVEAVSVHVPPYYFVVVLCVLVEVSEQVVDSADHARSDILTFPLVRQ